MDSEFPDEDEEFEMRYAEEMEMMNEMGRGECMALSTVFQYLRFTFTTR